MREELEVAHMRHVVAHLVPSFLRRTFSKKWPRHSGGLRDTHEIVGLVDLMGCGKSSSKQLPIAKALCGKFGKARDEVVRSVGNFFFLCKHCTL